MMSPENLAEATWQALFGKYEAATRIGCEADVKAAAGILRQLRLPGVHWIVVEDYRPYAGESVYYLSRQSDKGQFLNFLRLHRVLRTTEAWREVSF